jgi:hypothetical protein
MRLPVIERFLGLYVHRARFTRLIVLSQKSGKELLCCLPRNGSQALVNGACWPTVRHRFLSGRACCQAG